MIYEISIEVPGFSGTLDLLVQWVRRFELDILDVRMSEVARQVAEETETDLLRFAPFLTVSKLLALKSRNLLPGQDEFEDADLDEAEEEESEEEPTRVRERLREVYDAIRGVGAHFKELATENDKRLRSFQTRSGELPEFIDEIAYIEEITPFDLMLTMNQILRRNLEDPVYRVKVDEAQNLSNRIAEVFDFLLNRRGSDASFDDVISEKKEKPEIVLSFLAVIFLVSQGKVFARQSTPYGDITITITQSDRRAL